MKYTINELANSKGVSPLVREALLQMEAELDATNRQVEILSDALAESRREVAAPVQEPVAFEEWLAKQHGDPEEIGFLQALRIAYIAGQDSITNPPAAQRQWVGLTVEEIEKACVPLGAAMLSFTEVARAIEAKLKEKNT